MSTYLFDFDGTLVNSMPTYAAVMRGILDELGVGYGEDIIKIITPLGYEGTADYFLSIGAKETKETLVTMMTERAIKEYTYNIEAKENVPEVLRELKKRGHSLNVLTASPHSMLDPCLKRLGVFELFDNVWSCSDFDTTKADPEIYVRAAKQLGVPVGELIFLDDNPSADATAKRAGARVIAVFDESSAEYAEEMKRTADAYVCNFSELL